MALTDEKIKEFQELYKEHFGKDISKEEAYKQGAKLLRLISILYRPKPVEDSKKFIANKS